MVYYFITKYHLGLVWRGSRILALITIRALSFGDWGEMTTDTSDYLLTAKENIK